MHQRNWQPQPVRCGWLAICERCADWCPCYDASAHTTCIVHVLPSGEAMAREDSCAEVAEEDEEEVEPAPKRKRASVGAKQIHTEPASRRTKASADAKTTNGAGTEAATAPKKRSKATSAGKSKAGKSSARTRGASK